MRKFIEGLIITLIIGVIVWAIIILLVGRERTEEPSNINITEELDIFKEEIRLLASEQNAKLEEQDRIIQGQQEQINGLPAPVTYITDTSTKEELDAYKECQHKYQKYSYCKSDRFRKKSAFNEMLKKAKKSESEAIYKKDKKEWEEKFDKCQEFIDECPL